MTLARSILRSALVGMGMLAGLSGCIASYDEASRKIAIGTGITKTSLQDFGLPSGGPVPGRETLPNNRDEMIQDTQGEETPFPAELLEDNAISFQSGDRLGLSRILARLTEITDIPHSAHYGKFGTRVPDGSDAATVEPVFDAPRIEGSLPTVLDRLAGHIGFAWDYDGNSVSLREYVFRRYRIHALPVQYDFAATIGGMESSTSVDTHQGIATTLESLAGAGGAVGYDPATGEVTAITRPIDQRRISAFVDDLNARLSTQIAFDVDVLTVSLSRAEEFGVELDFDLNDGNRREFALQSDRVSAGSAASVNVSIAAGGLDLSAVADAINRQGDIAVTTRTGTTITNNAVAPVQIVRETAFAERVETLLDTQGNIRTAIKPGKLTTGFEMVLMPRILDNGEILVRFNIRISDLNSLAEFHADRQRIQLPEVSTVTFEQQAILQDGQALVLAGFERESTRLGRTGFTFGEFRLFDLRTAAKTERVATVLSIRPTILNSTMRHHAVGSDKQE